MEEVRHTNGLVTHRQENPFKDKVFAIQTINWMGAVIFQKELQFQSQAEFHAALEEVEQYNNEEKELSAGLIKKLVVLK